MKNLEQYNLNLFRFYLSYCVRIISNNLLINQIKKINKNHIDIIYSFSFPNSEFVNKLSDIF